MKPSSPLLQRLRHIQMNSKTGPRGYYKGTRTGSMGSHTKYGGYRLDYFKVRTYVVPEGLASCRLTPFVTNVIRPMRGQFGSADNLPISGENYLRRWKEENGED